MSFRHHYIEAVLIPQLRFAQTWVKQRFLPTFERLDQEADDIAENSYQSAPMDEWDDGADAADRAFEKGSDFFISATAFRQGFVNLLFVHLYHLLEQQLVMVVRNVSPIDPRHEEDRSASPVKAVFEQFRFDPQLLVSWTAVEELRLIANTVKHPDARDSRTLRKRRPELFRNPWAFEITGAPDFGVSEKVHGALAGDDFFPAIEEYDSKVEAIIRFWKEFASVVEGEQPPKSLKQFVSERKGEILAITTSHRASNPRLFGSVARGEAGPDSDVDLLLDFAPGTSLAEEESIARELGELLGRKVDVASGAALKPRVRERALREAIPL